MDHYERLRVSRDAPLEVIRAAYRALASKHHPDRHGQSEGAHFDMALLNGAYEVLSDPMQRAQYDADLKLSEMVSAGVERGAAGRPDPGAGAEFSGKSFDNVVDRDLADALSDIDWESLKSPPPVNPWLTRRRLVPLAVGASLLLVAGVVWWVNELARQMEAERAISAHLGHMASAGAEQATTVEPKGAPVMDLPPSRPVGAVSEPTGAPKELVLGGPQRAHMLDGEPLLTLHLDSRPNPALKIQPVEQ